MSDFARDDAIAAAQRLRDSAHEIVTVFTAHEKAIGRLLEVLQTPTPLTDILGAVDFARERDAIAGAIDRFETARRESRIAAWRLLLKEGCSIGQVARMFSLSRQLVSRQLKEAGVEITDEKSSSGESSDVKTDSGVDDS
jgi:hypothetical protein